MGVSMSTLFSWGVTLGVLAVIAYPMLKKQTRGSVRAAPQHKRLEEKTTGQSKKEPKEKAKRQRVESYGKDSEEPSKASQVKPRAPAAPTKPSKATKAADDSSDDGLDNKEFARQLASIKQGTNLNAPKKSDEKRQKSVKQSRAEIRDEAARNNKVSSPSSTTGVDGDDDASSTNASPEVKAADAGDVSDMLEAKSFGPSVLRLTDTDKAKPKSQKKAKEPEKTETKKQRQNRRKKELEQEQRLEDEKQRKAAEETQRRTARIAEGRAAKDGSEFTNKAVKESVWTGNGAKVVEKSATNGDSAAVQPLDTFETGSFTDVSMPKSPAKPANDEWVASVLSEEEQLKLIQGEDEWNTVKTKKSNKKKRDVERGAESESAQASSTPQPQSSTNARPINGTGKPTKSFQQQSSFAALTSEEPQEEEWEV
ncbi:hypothetical protein QBC35DRAFT_377645 [Podospora australis]|uniref:Uncharacterized protein n=1 Tax=Podospora australis TaxID=1536484 RepID=A0AAN6WYG1_9PEZI|nr:hypothetical protein QBC35DRAFT_377645 [Podospora australis]